MRVEEKFSDDEFRAFCQANPNLRVERSVNGAVVIAPPAGAESDYQSTEVIGELRTWARKTSRGKCFGSSIGFWLPDGSERSPDSAWVSNERLSTLTKEERRDFLRLVPEFVVEVMSPSDRPAAAKRKMRDWIANGVDLGWLIDGKSKSVFVFRPGAEPECLSGIESIAGEGPVAGFVLNLREIWEGL